MRLHSTLSRALEELPPPPGPIRMYVCGSTVYQRVHVGNSRPFVLAMWLRRWLRERGYERDPRPQHHRRRRQGLRGGGQARQAEPRAGRGGDAVVPRRHGRPRPRPAGRRAAGERDDSRRSSPSSRRCSRRVSRTRRRATSTSGSRATRTTGSSRVRGRTTWSRRSRTRPRRIPRDFALWKAQKPHEDAAWDSPWGPGRPGWHIECSAMAEKHLGPEFEIHGGGLDLRFPHHENELAQSRSRGYPFAHVWLHNGMLELGAEKMSKSLGNVVTLRNVLDVWGREVLLLFLMSGHWRKPIDFTDEALERARTQLAGFREALALPERESPDEWSRLAAALDDDFNTPDALAVLHDWAAARGTLAARARARHCSGSTSSTSRRPSSSSSAGGARRRGRRRTGRLPTRRGRRSRRRRLGGDRPPRRHRDLAAAVTAAPDLVYGRRAVREALRGRREVLELLATERAAREEWGRKPKVRARASADRDRRNARPPGRRRAGGAVRLRGRLRARRRGRAAARLPRPGHRPAQPGRRDPERRGGGGDRRRSCRRTTRRASPRRSPAPRPAPSSTCRSRSSPTSPAG